MGSEHLCAYNSFEIVIETENIRRYAKEKNKKSVDNHLTLLEKEYDKMMLSCGMVELVSGKETLKDIRTSLNNDQYEKIDMYAKKFEKDVLLSLAEQANEGNDPMDIVPSRIIETL